jgi:Flp pilus assembly protein TadG
MLKAIRQRWRCCRQGNVTVEFALLATFLLLPLLAGSADLVVIISAQGQLNTALQALYYFGVSTPGSAVNAVDAGLIVSAINNASLYNLRMPATLSSGQPNPSFTYVCYTTGATGASVSFSAPSTTNNCTSSQTAQYYANYKVQVTVFLPFPLPVKMASPLTLSASGSVQTQ